MWNVCGRGELHTGLLWGNVRGRDNMESVGISGRIIMKSFFTK
jgi:hypothetical protein